MDTRFIEEFDELIPRLRMIVMMISYYDSFPIDAPRLAASLRGRQDFEHLKLHIFRSRTPPDRPISEEVGSLEQLKDEGVRLSLSPLMLEDR